MVQACLPFKCELTLTSLSNYGFSSSCPKVFSLSLLLEFLNGKYFQSIHAIGMESTYLQKNTMKLLYAFIDACHRIYFTVSHDPTLSLLSSKKFFHMTKPRNKPLSLCCRWLFQLTHSSAVTRSKSQEVRCCTTRSLRRFKDGWWSKFIGDWNWAIHGVKDRVGNPYEDLHPALGLFSFGCET